MSLTKEDLTEIKKIVVEAIVNSEDRTAKKIDSAILSSEDRTAKKIDSAVNESEAQTAKNISESEQRTISKLEQKIDDLTLLTGQGFNEVSEKLELIDDKVENIKSIVKAEVERNDKQESTISKIRKQLKAV